MTNKIIKIMHVTQCMSADPEALATYSQVIATDTNKELVVMSMWTSKTLSVQRPKLIFYISENH